jgi:outer membrane lipoprotein-sorting protein
MAATRWTIAGSLVAFMLVAGSSPLRGDEATEQLMADLKAKAAAVKSYRADMTTTMQMMGRNVSMRGSILFKKPKKTRTETAIDMGAMKMDQIQLSDGKTTWIYQPEMKLAMKIDMEKVVAATKKESAGEKTTDISCPFQCLQPENITHVRNEEIDGGKACVFQGLPEKSDMQKIPFAPAKIELWIGADDGLLRRMVFFNEEGKEMMSQSYTNIQRDVEVPDDQFEFTPPEGTQVVDMTEGTIAMLKQMEPKAE